MLFTLIRVKSAQEKERPQSPQSRKNVVPHFRKSSEQNLVFIDQKNRPF